MRVRYGIHTRRLTRVLELATGYQVSELFGGSITCRGPEYAPAKI